MTKRICEADTLVVEFLLKVGISLETARRCDVRYDGGQRCLIFPLTGGGYSVRSVDGRVRVKQPFYGVRKGIFNPEALYRAGASCVFLTDSIIDCLSIEQVGGSAIGLCGNGGGNKLLDLLKEKWAPVSFVVCTYSYHNAAKCAELQHLAEALGDRSVVRNLCGGYKHIHDRLLADCEGLKADVGAFL